MQICIVLVHNRCINNAKNGGFFVRPKVLVVGSMAMDLIVRTDRMPKTGETVIGAEFHRALGGKGANQAVAASRLGADVTMVGRVGDDPFGHDQMNGFRAENIDARHVYIDSNATTGVALITLSGGDNQIIIVPGANMECTEQDVDRAEIEISQADIIILQLEIPLEVSHRVVRKATELGKAIVFNPAPAQTLDEDVLKSVTVLTPNETEAETLTGIAVESIKGAEKAALDLLKRGVAHVVITLGGDGALIASGNDTAHVPSFSVDVVDPTAAGDTFNGALAVKLGGIAEAESINMATLTEAVRFANAAGALAVTKMGAQPSIPTLRDVERFLSEQV